MLKESIINIHFFNDKIFYQNNSKPFVFDLETIKYVDFNFTNVITSSVYNENLFFTGNNNKLMSFYDEFKETEIELPKIPIFTCEVYKDYLIIDGKKNMILSNISVEYLDKLKERNNESKYLVKKTENNLTVIPNTSVIDLNASACKDKLIRSKEVPTLSDYRSFGFDNSHIAREICSNSNNSLTEYQDKSGQVIGYCIYSFSPTGKRIKDEFFDSKGRLMKQSLYEYSTNDKAKFMFVVNYLGEITSLRAVETDGMIDVNFESPYPTSKEKAIDRYNHPYKLTFTDMCQDCKGTGYGNNNLKRCYVCNGGGTITHVIIKY
jgi:hypothetical protein